MRSNLGDPGACNSAGATPGVGACFLNEQPILLDMLSPIYAETLRCLEGPCRLQLHATAGNSSPLHLQLVACSSFPSAADVRRAGILDNTTSTNASAYGGDWTITGVREDHGTSHLSVVDAERNAVSFTTTINTSFGSKVVSRSTGAPLVCAVTPLPTCPRSSKLLRQ